jgi:hypothetical protein
MVLYIVALYGKVSPQKYCPLYIVVSHSKYSWALNLRTKLKYALTFSKLNKLCADLASVAHLNPKPWAKLNYAQTWPQLRMLLLCLRCVPNKPSLLKNKPVGQRGKEHQSPAFFVWRIFLKKILHFFFQDSLSTVLVLKPWYLLRTCSIETVFYREVIL